MRERLEELDGFRSLAVALVILFHYFARFPETYPYGDLFQAVAAYGELGVDLFFVISGFVIALTLRASRSFLDFVWRRLIRLLPAMLVCATVTFVVMWSIDTSFTVSRRAGLEGFLPSLTFTDPRLWTWAFPEAKYIDGAYWSLFAEVRFYFWAAVLAFCLGKSGFARNFLAFTLAAAGVTFVAQRYSEPLGQVLNLLFVADFLHLFCAGVLLYSLFEGDRSRYVLYGLATSVSLVAIRAEGAVAAAVTLTLIGLFPILIARRHWLKPFKHPALIWLGLCSYPIYLLHQNVGVAVINLVPSAQPIWTQLGVVGLVTLSVIFLASAVHLFVEKPLQKWGRNLRASRPVSAVRQPS